MITISTHWTTAPYYRSYAPHLVQLVSHLLYNLDSLYPDFNHWFRSKILGPRHFERRCIITAHVANKIAGIAILKSDPCEKKICTLSVTPEFRRHSIGKILFLESLMILNTPQPHFTISSRHIDSFYPLLERFNFQLSSIKHGLYRTKNTEFIFNLPTHQASSYCFANSRNHLFFMKNIARTHEYL